MKIRITGLLDEVPQATERLDRVFDSIEISQPYAGRGNSRQYIIYREVRL
jgi:hypothetical protein